MAQPPGKDGEGASGEDGADTAVQRRARRSLHKRYQRLTLEVDCEAMPYPLEAQADQSLAGQIARWLVFPNPAYLEAQKPGRPSDPVIDIFASSSNHAPFALFFPKFAIKHLILLLYYAYPGQAFMSRFFTSTSFLPFYPIKPLILLLI
jgi:hypothetical protein